MEKETSEQDDAFRAVAWHSCHYCSTRVSTLAELRAHCEAQHGGQLFPAPTVTFMVNGEPKDLRLGYDVHPSTLLVDTLRSRFRLTGTKIGCDRGGCGACTVLVDGVSTLSCMTLTVECAGKSIVTIEGVRDKATGRLHPVQQSFIDHWGFQCGYCTPGMIMRILEFLSKNPKPTREEIQEAISGNICRCTGYQKIVESILAAAQRMREWP